MMRGLRKLMLPLALAAAGASGAEPPAAEVAADVQMGERTVRVLFAEPVVSMPTEVGSSRLVNEHRYDDPRHGAMYRFEDGMGVNIDVFVYPLPDAALVGDDEKALDWIEEDFRNGLKAARDQGNYKRLKFLDSDDLDLEKGERNIVQMAITGRFPPGDIRHVTARFELQGERMFSELVCFHVEGLAVKIRRSQPEVSARRDLALEFGQLLHASSFVSMPKPDRPDVVYANRFTGLNGVIGASVRAQLEDAPETPPAPLAAPAEAPPAETPPLDSRPPNRGASP